MGKTQKLTVLVCGIATGTMAVEAGQALWQHSERAGPFLLYMSIALVLGVISAVSDTWDL